MAIGDIIVGIDIGTTKVCTILGEVNNLGQIEIICSTSYKCNGLKKTKILYYEKVTKLFQIYFKNITKSIDNCLKM